MSSQVNINLRALEPEDVELLYQWENDRANWLLSDTIAPFSRLVLQKYLDSSHLDIYQTKQLRMMIDISEKEEWRTVGSIDLFDFNPTHRRAGVGILIARKDDRGKGIAKQALKELIKYAFQTLKLHQLYCNIQANNQDSMNLFSNIGFVVIGIKKEWLLTISGFQDEVLLQLINPNIQHF